MSTEVGSDASYKKGWASHMSILTTHYLSITSRNGTVVLTSHSSARLRLIGASCTATGNRRDLESSSISFGPIANGNNAVVAFVLWFPNSKGIVASHERVVLGIRWEDDKVIIDHDHHFTSTHCSLSFGSDDCLELTVPGNGKFVYDPGSKSDRNGVMYVNDPDMLCRFANREINFGSLKEAVGADTRTCDQIEIEDARNRIQALRYTIERQLGEIATKSTEIDKLKATVTALDEEARTRSVEHIEALSKITQLEQMRILALSALETGFWWSRVREAMKLLRNRGPV